MFNTSTDGVTDGLGVTPPQLIVASSGVVYSSAVKIGAASVMSLAIYCVGSAPNMKVEMQVSDTAPAALENLVDSNGQDWCIQEGGSPIFTAIQDNNLHKITIAPVLCKYIRLKLTNNGANSTTVFAKIMTQQQLGV